MEKLLRKLIGVPEELFEMAEVFHMPFSLRLKHIYLPYLSGREAGKGKRAENDHKA